MHRPIAVEISSDVLRINRTNSIGCSLRRTNAQEPIYHTETPGEIAHQESSPEDHMIYRMGVRRPGSSCNTCRQRRVKCDGIRPVCGKCERGGRQCLGFGEPNRLIVKNETEAVIKKLNKRGRTSSTETSAETTCPDPENIGSPCLTEQGDQLHRTRLRSAAACETPIQYSDVCDSSEWYPSIAKVRMTPAYENHHAALFCCRETINVRTMSWIMADDKWIETLPEMMSRSEALSSVINANAWMYFTKAAGAKTPPQQALTHYASALRGLQNDLYDPIRQTTDETLFAIILLGLHNNRKLGSWQAHVIGATKVIECNGSEHYKRLDSPSRVLAKYVRGFDIIRAISNSETTIFGDPEWFHLGEEGLVRPFDSLLNHYGRITNLIARSEKIESPSVDQVDSLLINLKALKRDLEAWKNSLPSYYEPILMPISESDKIDRYDALQGYQYSERLDYRNGFIGHTMNMYRAAILHIDRHLIGHIFPYASPSEDEKRLAKEIVMSIPSMSTSGGIFLLYPAVRAAKVADQMDRFYIVRILNKISSEVPVAGSLAEHVMEYPYTCAPSQEQCKTNMQRIFNGYYDTTEDYIQDYAT